MNLTTKKTISREILILLSSIGISLIFFFGTFGYNFYKVVRSNYLFQDINTKEKELDQLSVSFESKQKQHIWYFTISSPIYSNVGSNKEYDTEKEFWNYSLKYTNIDTITKKWKEITEGEYGKLYLTYYKENGFTSPMSIKEFIENNTISNKDSTDYTKSLIVRNEITELKSQRNTLLESKLSFDEQKRYGYISFISLLSVLFGLRYIYYLTKWCIKTLKE